MMRLISCSAEMSIKCCEVHAPFISNDRLLAVKQDGERSIFLSSFSLVLVIADYM